MFFVRHGYPLIPPETGLGPMPTTVFSSRIPARKDAPAKISSAVLIVVSMQLNMYCRNAFVND
ncbi:MAG: hypothetical protein JW781_04095 [Deltaproteobacteria bacterium]|nr:hypothetical protein [Candidatus Anaeroferrophillacea bacterium]